MKAEAVTPDWADEKAAALELYHDEDYGQSWNLPRIAAALREAKREAVRECARDQCRLCADGQAVSYPVIRHWHGRADAYCAAEPIWRAHPDALPGPGEGEETSRG